jgi:multiple sugar transport system permease protein
VSGTKGGTVGGRRWPYAVALGAVALVFVLPLAWLFSVSLKTKAGMYAYPPRWLPPDASWANYRFVLSDSEVPWYLLNSFRVALAATTATLILGIPAAWVLSREDVRARGGLVTGLLALQMVSPMVLLVPIYGLIGRLRLVDTHAGLVLVYAAVQLPFTIVVLKSFFDALPASVLEAARLDGASRARVLGRVALPLVGPGLGATATFNLAWYWAEFALALVLLDSQTRFTIPVGLFSFQSGYETEWQLVAAASFIGLLPVIATFVLLQRLFVAGLTAGAVKG